MICSHIRAMSKAAGLGLKRGMNMERGGRGVHLAMVCESLSAKPYSAQ